MEVVCLDLSDHQYSLEAELIVSNSAEKYLRILVNEKLDIGW